MHTRLRHFLTSVGLILLFLHGLSNYTQAQNVQTNTDFAVELLAAKADSVLKSNGVQGFRLDFSPPTPVRLKLVQRLLSSGFRVYELPTETAEVTTMVIDHLLTFRYWEVCKNDKLK